MRTKIITLINAKDSLIKLLTQTMPAKTAYSIIRLAKTVEKEFLIFQEARNKTILTYCSLDDNKNPIVDDQNNIVFDGINKEKFYGELNELLNKEIDIWFDPITMKDLGDKLELKPTDLLLLEPFIKDEENTNEEFTTASKE